MRSDIYLNVDFKRNFQWLKPDQIPKPTLKHDLHSKNRMVGIWWSVKDVIYWELLPENTTINAIRYRAELKSH